MTATGRRTVIVWVAALGVAVMLVMAAATGPSGVVEDLGSDSTSEDVTSETTPEPDASADRADGDPRLPERTTGLSGWARDLVGFLLLLGALWATARLVRLVVVRLTSELPEKQLVLDLDPLPDVETGREAVRRDRERYDAALAGSDVRNGIVACWVLLEETAAAVGVPRRPADTATEFVVRFLHALDVDPRPVAALAALYGEARFSTHDLPADARSRAELALSGILADLDRWAPT